MGKVLESSVDLIARELVIHHKRNVKALCYYTDGLVDAKLLDETVIRPLLQARTFYHDADEMLSGSQMMQELMTGLIIDTSIALLDTYELGIEGVLSGDTLVFLEGGDRALLLATRGWESRSVDEPQTEPVVRGPRDGFTENIRTNTALLRRRIRDPQLRVEGMKIGTKSRTDVNIAYIKGTVKEGLVEEVKARLSRISIDAILDSGVIEEFVEDAPLSPFSTTQSTERPDKVAAALFEGRIAIFVDNSPFAVIVPVYFWQFLQASDDYYSRYWVGSFFRLVRFSAIFISLTLPSLYVMLVSFHHEMIPTALALSIAAGRESVPFPALVEAFLMEGAFELMREAGLRMPRPVGQAVSIVGALVIGQAAVQAGLVSPAMVIVVATTGISSFAIPNYAASFSVRLLRFPLLIAAGTMGLLGFAGTLAMIVVHSLSLRSFGEPYMSPATPFRPEDQKDIIIRVPWWRMNKRPQLAQGDLQRMAPGQMPKPPDPEDKPKRDGGTYSVTDAEQSERRKKLEKKKSAKKQDTKQQDTKQQDTKQQGARQEEFSAKPEGQRAQKRGQVKLRAFGHGAFDRAGADAGKGNAQSGKRKKDRPWRKRP
ncbi:spore germination protein [Tumebacillus avium]|uniref:Spore germination protein n=2 Tax=Tumebacillus avium TaxID=1903704 RepID=A0A1Y0IWM7_9BACL|nr:spore germination protein [Tumebacillus avium]